MFIYIGLIPYVGEFQSLFKKKKKRHKTIAFLFDVESWRTAPVKFCLLRGNRLPIVMVRSTVAIPFKLLKKLLYCYTIIYML